MTSSVKNLKPLNSTNEQIQIIKEQYLSPMALAVNSAHKFMIIAICSIFINVLLGVSVFLLTLKNPTYLKLSDQNAPEVLVKTKGNIDFSNYKLFVQSFLEHLYNLDQNTYVSQLEYTMNLMSPGMQNDFYKQITDLGKIQQLQNGEIKSFVSVRQISNVKQDSKDTFSVQADVVLTRFTSFKKNQNQLLPVILKIEKCTVSPSNPWGMEVYALDEGAAQETPLGGQEQ